MDTETGIAYASGMAFDIERLIQDVFKPDRSEQVSVLVDTPTSRTPDSQAWAERRTMAGEWLAAFDALGLSCRPLIEYPCTGANNGNLPASGTSDGKPVSIADILADTDIAIAMTQCSATAPLSAFTRTSPRLRAASMPGVTRAMEKTALAADYVEVARKVGILADRLNRSDSALIEFETGHRCLFDLRHREAHADDGMCRRDKTGIRVINLPSGEAFIVPYEGERDGDPSRTEGTIPLAWRNTLVLLRVEANRIVAIEGDSHARDELDAHFCVDDARRNIAELGLGCNDKAVVSGNVLEDEKAGLHWAYGRSEHLGGITGPDAFKKPEHVVHHDIVYAKGCPIGINRLILFDPDDREDTIIRNTAYTCF